MVGVGVGEGVMSVKIKCAAGIKVSDLGNLVFE